MKTKTYKRIFCLILTLTILLTTFTVYAKENTTKISVIDNFENTLYQEEAQNYLSDLFNLISMTYTDLEYSSYDMLNMRVAGPYKIFNIDTREVNTIDYYLTSNGVILSIIHMYYYNGILHAEFAKDYASKLNNYVEKNIDFYLLHANDGIYIVTNNSVVDCIVPIDIPGMELSNRNNTSSTIISTINFLESSSYLISADNIKNSGIPLSINVVAQNNTCAASALPLVPQYENDIQKWCHNAVVATVASAREPIIYNGLSAGSIYSTTGTDRISSSYGRAKKICENLSIYLTSSDNHYNTYSTTPVSQSQYVNNINSDHYVIAVSQLVNYPDSYHATTMYDYYYGLYSTLYVRMVDPYNEYIDPISYRYCIWNNTNFTFSMYGNFSYTYQMYESVISWY